MRVSNNMMSNRVVFNVQRALGRFLEMQTQLSSGRRINKPSDDPLGILRDLDYRSELSKNKQFLKNISVGINWQDTYDSVLADLKDMATSVKEVAVSMANDTCDSTVRAASANEIQSILDRFIQIGNTELGDKSVFAGFKTNEKALIASTNGAIYNGDNGQIEFQVESSSRVAINLNGADVFLKQLSILGEHADLNVGLTGNTLLSDLNNGSGVDLTEGATPGTIKITDNNLGITSTIDLVAAGAVTVNDVLVAINAQLAVDGITDTTAVMGVDNNCIAFDTNASGIITNSTSLSTLNTGYGVDLDPGTIIVSDGGAINVAVDLSGSLTIGDVITKFNAAMAASPPQPALSNVIIDVDPVGNKGLRIRDTNGVPLGLNISDVAGDTTADNLGVIGDIDPTMTGSDLNPTVSFLVEETTGTTATDLGICDEFFRNYSGLDLDPQLVVTDNVNDLNNGSGFNLGRIVICQGNTVRNIDLSEPTIITVQDILNTFNSSGLNITASINADGRGIQIVNNDAYTSLTIEDPSGSALTRNLGIYGSSDMVGSISVLRNSLRNNDPEAIGFLIGNIDVAIKHLLGMRTTAGSRAISLETTAAHLQNQRITFTKLLSEIEDADITKVLTDLSTLENNYQASLMATAKILQPSLLNFLK